MPCIKRVHLAQQQFVEQDICAGYMSETDYYPYSKTDVWHYLIEGFVRMGRDFANKYFEVIKNCQ